MKSSAKRVAALFAGAAFAASAGHAATVTVVTDIGSESITQNGIRTDTVTRGVDLDGMVVTAGYADGSSETLIWSAYGTTFGGVTGASIDLSTGFLAFDLTTTKTLATLSLAAGAAGSLFDLFGGIGDTPGSRAGYPYSTEGGDALEGEIVATYSGAVTLAGVATAYDLFTDLLIDYTGLTGGGLLGTTSFATDLDTLADKTDLQTVGDVPLPAGLPLMLAGLGVLGLARRKRD